MKMRLYFAGLLAVLWLAGGAAATPAPTGRIVVKLAPDATLAQLERVAADVLPAATVERRFSGLAPADLEYLRTEARRRTGRSAPDLDRWAQVTAGDRDPERLQALARRLQADPAVALAYPEPVAVPAALGFDAFTGQGPDVAAKSGGDPALPTPDFSDLQGYLASAPFGIGALDVEAQPGARGATVRIVDVEGAWLWDHEDLPVPFFTAGVPLGDLSWRNHGTAVVGEMRGTDNGFGVRGIVPDSEVGGSSIGTQSVAGAILAAAAALDPGDLILIELHAPGPNANGNGQFGYVPMEYWQDNFEAIQTATALGVIVCEAAGNGQQDLDDPVYQGLFDPEVRDSGAIMIGATYGANDDPAWFTNHGQRVNCNGWGSVVATTGYGDLQGGDETEWYTGGFSGTSSASPIVTGAAASLQGMVEAWYGDPLDAFLARHILSTTGTEVNGPELIGTRPDLVSAWNLASQGIGTVTGRVTDQDTGDPVGGVLVTVTPGDSWTLTAPDGTYAVSLLAGSYTVHFSEYFHADTSLPVTVTAGPVVLDAALAPLPTIAVTGTVTDGAGGVGPARVRVLGAPLADVLTGPDGAFALGDLPLGRGLTLLGGEVPGLGGMAHALPIPGAAPATAHLELELPAVDYTFETGDDGFGVTGPGWERGDPSLVFQGPAAAFDGAFCFGVGMDGSNYGDEVYSTLVSPLLTPADFPGETTLTLSFHYWLKTEPGFDGLRVEVTGIGAVEPVGGYTDLSLSGLGYGPGWSGDSGGWRTAVFDLTASLGTSFYVTFVFGSDQAVNDEGAFVDGIALNGQPVFTSAPETPAPALAASLAAHPNPFNPQVTLDWAQPRSGPLTLAVYDLRGRLVRTLHQGTAATRGSVVWNGTDRQGQSVASGVYLVRLRGTDGATAVQRVMLAK